MKISANHASVIRMAIACARKHRVFVEDAPRQMRDNEIQEFADAIEMTFNDLKEAMALLPKSSDQKLFERTYKRIIDQPLKQQGKVRRGFHV